MDNITLQIADFSITVAVPYLGPINAHSLLDQGFVQLQTSTNADPFLYTVEYFGYSQSGFGYLGYELESINSEKNGTNDYYWSLAINGAAASVGMDSVWLNPGDVASWTYVSYASVKTSAMRDRITELNRRRGQRQTLRQARKPIVP